MTLITPTNLLANNHLSDDEFLNHQAYSSPRQTRALLSFQIAQMQPSLPPEAH